MGDDFRPHPAEHNSTEMMVRVMMGKDHPRDGCGGDAPDRICQLLPLLRARQCVDDENTFTGDHETGVGSALGPAAGISQGGVYAGSKAAKDRRWRREGGSRTGEESGEQEK